MKFRSKPVEIEARQLTNQRMLDIANDVERAPVGLYIDRSGAFICRTRQGEVQAATNDWIIQESDGSGCYPCKPDVFVQKYEPVTKDD